MGSGESGGACAPGCAVFELGAVMGMGTQGSAWKGWLLALEEFVRVGRMGSFSVRVGGCAPPLGWSLERFGGGVQALA